MKPSEHQGVGGCEISSCECNYTSHLRLFKALAIIAAIILLVPCLDIALGRHDVAQEADVLHAGIDASDLMEKGKEGDLEGLLARLEEMESAGVGEAPAWFDEEVGLLPGAQDVRASGSVVGYVVDGECPDALAALASHMEQRGWTAVSLGGIDGMTFVKESGRCTWTLVTCTQTGSATSVVFRCA